VNVRTSEGREHNKNGVRSTLSQTQAERGQILMVYWVARALDHHVRRKARRYR